MKRAESGGNSPKRAAVSQLDALKQMTSVVADTGAAFFFTAIRSAIHLELT